MQSNLYVPLVWKVHLIFFNNFSTLQDDHKLTLEELLHKYGSDLNRVSSIIM